jgi:preprotein translocase subunit SecE
MTNFITKISKFLKEVRAEMKKVTWLKRKQLFRYILAVIAVSGFIALFLTGLDIVFSFLVRYFAI